MTLASFFDPNRKDVQNDLFPPEYPIPEYPIPEYPIPEYPTPTPEPAVAAVEPTPEPAADPVEDEIVVDQLTFQRMAKMVSKRKRITLAEAEEQLRNCKGLFNDTYNSRTWH